MDIILIPGLWLDGSSWDEVVPVLEQAGHRTHALTLPGMESKDADRSEITLRDHVDAVIAAIDSVDPADGKVVLVGHSAGGAIAHAAVDARPDRVARVVYVGGSPRVTATPSPTVPGRERGGPAAGLVGLRGRGARRPRRRGARRVARARDPVARARHPRPTAALRRTPLRRAGHRHRARVHQRDAPEVDRQGRARSRNSARSATSSTSTCPRATGRSSPGQRSSGG